MSFISLFLSTGQGDVAMGSGLGMLIPLILVFLIMYFLMIRPQNKKQKETEAMIAALKKGDKVITIGGIHGVVSQTKENTVVLKVDDGTKIEFNRTAISTVVVDKPAEPAPKAEKKGFFGRKTKADKITEEIKDTKSEDQYMDKAFAKSDAEMNEASDSGEKKDE